MGIFDDIAALISGAVGNNHENKPDDVIRVKRALNERGLYDLSTPPEPHGYITQGMDDAIRAFQGEEGLKVDGYLLPGGETEAALKKTMREPAARETPEKPRAESSPLSFVNPLAAKRDEEAEDSRPVEYDASGRMIRPEEKAPAFALSQAIPPPRRPREEKPAPEKPAELDATGRVIRGWDDENIVALNEREHAFPVPPRKPSFEDSKNPAKSESKGADNQNPFLPKEKTDVFGSKERAQEWKGWVEHTETDKDLSPATKKAFRETYAFEGGMDKAPNSTAYAGIMQGTFDSLKKQGFADGIVAKYGKEVKAADLSQADIREVYKAYYNEAFKGAARTKGIPPDKGYKLLDTIGDPEVAAAFADVIFREDYMKTSELAQKALNAALPTDKKIPLGGGPGSQTFNALRTVASDPNKKRIFLDRLGDLRDEKFKTEGDLKRNEHFRYKK